MTLATAFPCVRCNGQGKIWAYANVLGGVCFKCHGSGTQSRKPAPPTLQWAVFFEDRITGNQSHAYNQSGRNEAEAIKRARGILERASEAFRSRFNPENATACHVSQVEVCQVTNRVIRK
jgi:hypothetical protein